MVQDFTEDSYDPDHVADTDLDNMEDNFLTLKSAFSGAASPANPVTGLGWYDTAKKVLKIRTATPAWVGIMHADASHKIPVYRNDQPDGWLIDTGVSDCVIGLKGGSQAYDTSAGAVAGTWTQPDHTLVEAEIPDHNHGAAGEHDHDMKVGHDLSGGEQRAIYRPSTFEHGNTIDTTAIQDEADHIHNSFGGDGAHNHGTTQRVRAGLCTLQYLDL